MTDKLISDLGSIGAAIADNTATEVQRNGQTTTEQALGSDWKTYIKSWIAKADVGLGNVSNNAQLTIANNLSDVNNAATSRTNLGFGAFPGSAPSATGIATVYNSSPTANASAAAPVALRLYMCAVYWPGGTATGMAFTVTAAGAAGKVARIGVYNIKADGTPGTLVVEPTSASPIAVDTTGTKTVSFSQAMNAGWYYLAFISDGTPTMGATNDAVIVSGLAFTGASAPNAVTFVSRTLGALAAFGDESGNTFTTNGAGSVRPLIGIK